MSAVAGACAGDGDAAPDSTTTTTTTGGTTTSSPTSGGDSASVTSSPAATSGTSAGTTATGMTTFCPNSCGEAVVTISIVPPSVMLVLDKSGSMVADPGGFWDHDQDPNTPTISRWNSLYSVVEGLVDAHDSSMNLGAVLFPSKAATSSYSEAACVVSDAPEVPVAAMNAATILGAIPAALSGASAIKGATPTTKGLKLAIQALAGVPAEQPRAMILVTDGAANCQENAPDTITLFEVYDDNVTETVAGALAMGITTYVVGIAISQGVSGGTKDGNPDNVDTHEMLNALALAGGAAQPGPEKFFNASNQSELQAAIDAISTQLVPCVIELDPSPKYPDFVEVAPYGKFQVTDCMTEDGWKFLPKLDPDDPNEDLRIELCGAACSDFQMRGHVDVEYRCSPDAPC